MTQNILINMISTSFKFRVTFYKNVNGLKVLHQILLKFIIIFLINPLLLTRGDFISYFMQIDYLNIKIHNLCFLKLFIHISFASCRNYGLLVLFERFKLSYTAQFNFYISQFLCVLQCVTCQFEKSSPKHQLNVSQFRSFF